jgi:hypothetical protein
MDSLIKYKLCDKHFKCDNCLFDKVMRNVKLEIEDLESDSSFNIIEQKLKRLNELEFSHNFIYLKNGLIVKNLFGNTYYLGISPLAYTLLDHCTGFNCCKDGTPVQPQNPIAQFLGKWGTYKLLSPLNFYCLGRLKQEIQNSSPHEWFLLIEANPADIESAKISITEYNLKFKEVEGFLSQINDDIRETKSELNNKGAEISRLCQLLNDEQYLKLLKILFSQD